jgi:hypothetical protein
MLTRQPDKIVNVSFSSLFLFKTFPIFLLTMPVYHAYDCMLRDMKGPEGAELNVCLVMGEWPK